MPKIKNVLRTYPRLRKGGEFLLCIVHKIMGIFFFSTKCSSVTHCLLCCACTRLFYKILFICYFIFFLSWRTG